MGGGTLMEAEFVKEGCKGLLSWSEYSNLVNIRPLVEEKRVNILNGPGWTWKCTNWNTEYNSYPASIMEEALENYICYVEDMSRCTKRVNEYAAYLEEQYGRQVSAHIYTCRNIDIPHPFGTHYDYHDNVIVQCEGQSNFKVWPKITITKDRNLLLNYFFDGATKERKDTPLLDVTMNPGDVIAIPKYYPHLATSNTKRMSISFPIADDPITDVQEDRHWIELD